MKLTGRPHAASTVHAQDPVWKHWLHSWHQHILRNGQVKCNTDNDRYICSIPWRAEGADHQLHKDSFFSYSNLFDCLHITWWSIYSCYWTLPKRCQCYTQLWQFYFLHYIWNDFHTTPFTYVTASMATFFWSTRCVLHLPDAVGNSTIHVSNFFSNVTNFKVRISFKKPL